MTHIGFKILFILFGFILFLLLSASTEAELAKISPDETGKRIRKAEFIKLLKKIDNRNHCSILSDVAIPESHETVDLLYTHGSGVYIIKVEDCLGDGAIRQTKEGWIDIYDYGYQDRPFQIDDPIERNQRKMIALRRIVPDHIPIYNIVVFTSNNYMGDIEYGTYTKVVNVTDIGAALTFPMDSDMMLSPAQIEAFTKKMQEYGKLKFRR